jgi:cell division protein FtsZ
VTIVATPPGAVESGAKSAGAENQEASEFTAELIHPTEGRRPKARLVPPAPELTAEQREQIITKQAGKSGRARRNAGPRMRQISLPLDIVNKGRFDKSEPTIYKGEDLDLPTYIRRGISLN